MHRTTHPLRRASLVTRIAVWSLTLAGCADANDQPRPFLSDLIESAPGEIFRGTLSPDGREFYFFRKVNPDQEDYRVFRARLEAGRWNPPELLALGDAAASNLYPVVSPDGGLLVFTSYRDVGRGTNNANLWVAKLEADGWGRPTLLDGVSTAGNYDASPWFGPGGALHFTSTSPDWRTTSFRRAARTGDTFGGWEEDSLWPQLAGMLPDHHFWFGTLDPQGTMAVVEVAKRTADGGLSDSDLWAVPLDSVGWGLPQPVSAVNTSAVENFPAFSPDGRQLFFVRNFSGIFVVPVTGLVPDDS